MKDLWKRWKKVERPFVAAPILTGLVTTVIVGILGVLTGPKAEPMVWALGAFGIATAIYLGSPRQVIIMQSPDVKATGQRAAASRASGARSRSTSPRRPRKG